MWDLASHLLECEFTEDEEELLRKMQKLDDAIYDFQHDDCGCGERMRLEVLKTLVWDIEKYV